MDIRHLQLVTAAVCRVTECMDDAEPLKWRLRAHAWELHNFFYQGSEHDLSQEGFVFQENILHLIFKVKQSLRLARSGSFVSRINFEILLNEYEVFEKYARVHNVFPKTVVARTLNRVSSNDESAFSERQKRIAEYLKTNSHSSISDIKNFFENTVGEKTIQRELNTLVVRGLVSAQGERRWRRYSVNS